MDVLECYIMYWGCYNTWIRKHWGSQMKVINEEILKFYIENELMEENECYTL